MSCTRFSRIVALTLIVVVVAPGCRHEGPYVGESITGGRGVSVERDAQFVLLDKAVDRKFSFEEPTLRRVANDRLEVIVDIRNRTNHNQSVDVSTVFRDEARVPIGDETAWTRVIFGPNQTQTYRVTSVSSKAATFTVRVREGM